MDNKNNLVELLDIMAALRNPDTGCPWDIKQNFASIAPYTLEEAYEVIEAIEQNDMLNLREELGDLLLQVVYHARIAEELGHFDFHDVAQTISQKMIRRHPHVFGSEEERQNGARPGFWERIKADEKQEKVRKYNNEENEENKSDPKVSLLDDVPAAMPALMRAVKLQKRAAKVGFDWPDLAQVFAKMREELTELEVALSEANQKQTEDKHHIEEEFGDLLFVMANVARHLTIEPETALRGANAKFTSRFHYIEQRLAEMGKTPEQSSLIEMDALWDEAKAKEKPISSTEDTGFIENSFRVKD
ncbi:MAG: nucleoside triphosphate pyrophosphohydrolase [Pseudomonadota bacterium]